MKTMIHFPLSAKNLHIPHEDELRNLLTQWTVGHSNGVGTLPSCCPKNPVELIKYIKIQSNHAYFSEISSCVLQTSTN